MYKFLITLFLLKSVLGKVSYENYSLYRVVPKSVEQVKVLQEIQNNDSRFDFWTDPTPSLSFIDILSGPENKIVLENVLNKNGIPFQITMSNIQDAINRETRKTYTRGNPKSMSWNGYYTNDEINAWLDDLVSTYPDTVTSIIGGNTFEGRQIKGIKISHGTGKRVIFIEGGIHSREWISPAVVCYITNELLTSDAEEIKAAAREFDWYIFPVTNPDGYIWSFTENRLWRKNRRPVGNSFGVDLNRNWNNNWLAHGASLNAATDTYAGAGPFSEPETKSLSTFIRSIGDEIDIYLSFHSYGELLLIPFGNTTEPLANYHDAVNVGRRAMGALSVRYGTQYITGNIAEAIYHATGGSVDWVKEHLKVPLVYCYELRDKGNYGFLLPPEEILPTGQETMDSLIELIHQAKRFNVISGANSVAVCGLLLVFSVLGLLY